MDSREQLAVAHEKIAQLEARVAELRNPMREMNPPPLSSAERSMRLIVILMAIIALPALAFPLLITWPPGGTLGAQLHLARAATHYIARETR